MESSEKSLLLQTYQKLLLTCPENDLRKSFAYFRRILFLVVQEEKSNSSKEFEGISWKDIRERISTCDPALISCHGQGDDQQEQKAMVAQILDVLKGCRAEHFQLQFFMDLLHFTL